MFGTVKVLKDKGFGFIRPEGKGADVFFHVSDLAPDLPRDATLTERRVEFGVAQTEKGPRAISIHGAD